MNYWDIVKEMDRQRWDSQIEWTQDQYDMFHEVRDRLELIATIQEEMEDE